MVGGEDFALLEKHGEKIVCTIVLAKMIFIRETAEFVEQPKSKLASWKGSTSLHSE